MIKNILKITYVGTLDLSGNYVTTISNYDQCRCIVESEDDITALFGICHSFILNKS